MKYYKTFEAYNKSGIEGGDGWKTIGSAIGSIYSSIFSGISITKKNIQMNILTNQFDDYLEAVYSNYLNIKYGELKDDDSDSNTNIIDSKEYKTNNTQELSRDDVQIIPKNISDQTKKDIESVNIGNVVEFDINKDINKDKDNDIIDHEQMIKEIDTQKKIIKEIETKLKKLESEQDKDEDTKKYGLTDKSKDGADERIKIRNNDIKRVGNDLEIAKKELEELDDQYNSIVLKEKVNWSATDTINSEWTSKDVSNITDMVNPYQIEEIFLKANNIINSNEKHSKSLEQKWKMNINSVYKKWYYIFDTTKLQNKTSPFQDYNKRRDNGNDSGYGSDKKGSFKLNKKEDTYKVVQTFEQLYGDKTVSYTSPKFYGINNDESKWFILSIGMNRSYLVKKEFINSISNKLVFMLVSDIIFDPDTKNIKSSNNYKNKKEIVLDKSNKLNLYTETYPFILLSKDKVYNIDNWNSITIGSYVLTSLSNELISNINKSNNNIIFDIKNDLSDSKIEEIKNK